MSLSAATRLTGISGGHISLIENGKRCPDTYTMYRLAQVFPGITIHVIQGDQ